MQSMFRRMRDKNHLVNNFTDGVERVRNRFDMFFLFYDSLVSLVLKTTPLKFNASKEATKASGRKLGYFVRYSRPGLLEGWKCYQRLSAGKISIRWIVENILFTRIRSIATYPLESFIQPLNEWAQWKNPRNRSRLRSRSFRCNVMYAPSPPSPLIPIKGCEIYTAWRKK